MREAPILASLALAAALGVGAGYLFAPRDKVADATHPSGTPSPSVANSAPAVTQIVQSDPNGDPPVVYRPWNSPEKEAALRRVEKLSQTEAEYLCFTLELIPRDEVFDKVNVKGRLTRYINSMSEPSDLRDLERAFRQMAMR
jgi:hypothetical protein